jgi:hypothetical protein
VTALYCLAATYPGQLAAAALAPAIATLVANPWAPLAEQCADTSHLGHLDWRAHDAAAATALLGGTSRALFLRERAGDGAIEAQVWNKLATDTSAILYVPAARTAPDDPRLRAHLAAAIAALPPGAFGSIFASPTPAPPSAAAALPPPLHRLPWVAALPAALVAQRFDGDALLAAPAGIAAARGSDGAIWLQVYRDPLAPTADDLRAACAYLAGALRR